MSAIPRAFTLLGSPGLGTGDVVGPASATDNAIVRFDGTTGKGIQNSAVTIADTTGAMVWAAGQDASLTAGSSGASLTLGQGASGVGSLTASVSSTPGTNGILTLRAVGTNPPTGYGGGLVLAQQASSGNVRNYASIVGVRQNSGGSDLVDLAFWTGSPDDGIALARRMTLTAQTGNLLIGGTTDITGSGGLKVFGSTASTSTTSGAFQVVGGAGIGGTVNAPTFSNGTSYTLWTTSNFTELQSSATAGLRLKTTNVTPVVIAVNGSTTAATFASDGSTTLAGNLTVSGTRIVSTDTLSGAGAVSVTKDTTKLTSTGAGQAITLADGTDGQIKHIIHDVDGGSMILTPTTKTGYTTITFTNAGDAVTLEFVTTRGWIVVGSFGVTIA